MKRNTVYSLIMSVIVATVFCGGCTITPASNPVEVTAKYSAQPFTKNFNIDSKAWASVPAYSFGQYASKNLTQGGTVKFLWDNNYLYVGAWLDDDDIVTKSTKNHQLHFQLGDVVEVFLKPINGTIYWETYGTPRGCKTSLFHPGRGRIILPKATNYRIKNLKVSANVNGTLNYWKDKDKSWSVIIAIPFEELKKYNVKVAPGQTFQVMVGRYNYSRYLKDRELSCFPANSGKPKGFHSYEQWAVLTLKK